MIIEYDKDYLRELYDEGKCKDKKHRYPQIVVKNYQKRIDTLMAATRIEDLFPFNSLNFESLEGRTDEYSIRINLQYRLEFSVRSDGAEPVLKVCKILDITNHYK